MYKNTFFAAWLLLVALPVSGGTAAAPAADPLKALEQRWGISLQQRTLEEMTRSWEVNGYVLEKGAVVALNLAFLKKVDDLGFVRDFPRLRHLYLMVNPIRDITPLAELRELTHLNLSVTYVEDLSPLRHLSRLQVLNLFKTPVRDLSPLASLKELVSLKMARTQVVSIEPLRKLENLVELECRKSPITDLPLWVVSWCPRVDLGQAFRDCPLQSPPRELARLGREAIRIYHDMCRGVPVVAQGAPLNERRVVEEVLRRLDHDLDAQYSDSGRVVMLRIDLKGASDLNLLAPFVAIRTLSVTAPEVRDLGPLKRFAGLKTLGVDRAGKADLSTLPALESLRVLSLSGLEGQDLGGIRILRHLERLRLLDAGALDLSPLGGALALRHLYLDRTGIRDYTFLSGLSHLKTLRISESPLDDLAPLKPLDQLEELVLTRTKITSLPAWVVDWNPQLDLRELTDNPLSDPPATLLDRGREKLRAYFGAVRQGGPGSQQAYLYRQTVAGMQEIAQGLKEYQDDVGELPQADSSQALINRISPFYVPRPLQEDLWGRPLVYQRIGKQEYLLKSAGSDGVFEEDPKGFYKELRGQDIVLRNGRFIAAPAFVREE